MPEVEIVTLPPDIEITRKRDGTEPVFNGSEGPAFSCFVLTPEGEAVCAILEDRQFEALTEYGIKLADWLNILGVKLWRGNGRVYEPHSQLVPNSGR